MGKEFKLESKAIRNEGKEKDRMGRERAMAKENA